MRRRLTKDAFKLHTVTICMLTRTACGNDCRNCQVGIEQHQKVKVELEQLGGKEQK